MRTRKLLVPLVVCFLCMGQLLNCQEEKHYEKKGRAKLLAKYHKKTFKEKYLSDFTESGKEEDSGEEDEYAYSLGTETSSSLYRNNRAIDVPGSTEGNSGKSGQQSTPSNLPRHSLKPSELAREKDKKHKNMTIGDGICQSIDIRNNVNNFEMLKDCRVIEGFLQIVLIENNIESDFQNVTFPQLREITGYFLLYRVNRLKTLNNMFPNLEVIRGDILLADYSFMIYEMQHLQEIGLNKLTKISRGAVRIEKNPSLCYTSTLDWGAIVVAGENFIKDNCNEIACPVCTQCPGGYCWNANYCQKIERPRCHHQCLGECFGPTEVDCYICKNYRHEGRCVESCPPDLFAYLSRRCITKEECRKANDLRQAQKVTEERKWRPFNGSCLTQCPNGFEDAIDENNMTTCRVCQGRCQKIGQSAIIRHISDAQGFRGTTIVKGAVEFQIRNGNPNIINELTDAFGMVEEITEYLKVTHSFPITSLSFFKSLRVIKGEQLDINNASLVVLDNPNLSNLFQDDQKIEIQNGRLFFHYNPKLCISKIQNLGRMAGITNISDLEIQPDSNGDKVACNIVNINITAKEKGSSYATLVWSAYKPGAGQRLLGYMLNYIETESNNVSYEGNACGNNTWQIIDVEIPKSDVPTLTVSQKLTDLKPYTRYAVYVKTLAARNKTSSKSQTGQSRMIYFRTKSDVPSVPTALASFPVSESEIIVKWQPPEYPNGPIGYYIIAGFIRLEDKSLLEARNYCKHGLVSETEIEEVTEVSVTTPPAIKELCCANDLTLKTTSSKKFEIFCHENMTISFLSTGRKNYCYSNRYNVGEPNLYGLADYLSYPRATFEDSAINDDHTKVIDDTSSSMRNGIYNSFVFNVSMNSSSYLLNKLRHYSFYTISVAACGRKFENDKPMCSSVEYTNSRTKKRPNADDIRQINVEVLNDTIVNVSWDVPKDPNGLTVTYTIEYTNLIVKDAKKSAECVPATPRRQKRAAHYIRNLSPGKYSVRVRSTSLAGDGAFSETVNFSIGLKEDNTVLLVVIVTFVFLLASLVIAYLVFYNYRKKKQQERLIASVNPDYMETKYIRDSWEVSRENIELLEELGLGNFGMVYRGILDGTMQVAVKTIADNSGEREKNEFLNEASVMKNFSTFHIIRLLGVVSEGNPPYVIMELMENGDLKTYLRRIRDSHLVPEISRVIRMACEIADGMAYLESKKFVHRDLAARNCMVSKDLVCKIGDFGMARDIYETDYYKIGKKGLLPIRWMAPENLSDGVFTSDSDVWSYGVVLYEILTLAEIPYQGFSNEEVLNYVLSKGTVNVPRNSPEMIIKIMEKCFKWRPSDRPTFMELVAELEPFISQDFCEKSFYHSEEGVEIRNLGLKKVYHHAAPIRFHWGNETARWVREFEDNVTLLDQTKAGTSRGRIFKNGFQHFGNLAPMVDVPLDR